MTHNKHVSQPKSPYSNFKRVPTSQDQFEVYEIAANLFVFHEPRHYEATIVNLLIGKKSAIVMDTGCGIGNLRNAVEEVTDKPIVVINTHTHLDYLGSNRQFDEIAMLDRPLSRRVADKGASRETLQTDILSEGLVTPPWPQGFDPGGFLFAAILGEPVVQGWGAAQGRRRGSGGNPHARRGARSNLPSRPRSPDSILR